MRVVSFLISILFGGILIVFSAPDTAEAGTNFGLVSNNTGALVRIDCDYGHGPYHTLYEFRDKRPSVSWVYCSDTDRFKALYDLRCMTYRGPQYKDGMYKLRPNVWRKVSGLAIVRVYAYTYDRCGRKPYFNLT